MENVLQFCFQCYSMEECGLFILYIRSPLWQLTVYNMVLWNCVKVCPWVQLGSHLVVGKRETGWCSSGMLVWFQIRYVQKTISKWRLQQRHRRWVFTLRPPKKAEQSFTWWNADLQIVFWNRKYTSSYCKLCSTLLKYSADISPAVAPFHVLFSCVCCFLSPHR